MKVFILFVALSACAILISKGIGEHLKNIYKIIKKDINKLNNKENE
ncbi:MAG: hypothetical protein IJ672_07925 [Methanobrevibacter sp.]|nr:hypothetical protein [Methanobrevibacter sp.]